MEFKQNVPEAFKITDFNFQNYKNNFYNFSFAFFLTQLHFFTFGKILYCFYMYIVSYCVWLVNPLLEMVCKLSEPATVHHYVTLMISLFSCVDLFDEYATTINAIISKALSVVHNGGGLFLSCLGRFELALP